MVACKNCTTQNSLDSTFCKTCGATLPADDLQQAKQKLDAVVADGYKIFSAGRTDEAMQIAETAVQANPLSTTALSLKAMCHERLGQISEALECHERVLDIDPDSMIDKIKVNDLRNLLVARSSIAAIPDRRIAIGSAVAAFVLVASIGLVIARTSRGDDKRVASNVQQQQTEAHGATGPQLSTPPPTSSSQPGAQQQSTPQQTQQQSPSKTDSNERPANSADPHLPPYSRPDGAPKLPNPNGNQSFGGNDPVLVKLPDGFKPNAPSETTPKTEPASAPSRGEDPQPGALNEPPAKKQESPGIMEIKIVSRNGKPTEGGSDSASHANGVEALMRTARNQYQLGNYAAAATSYERALRGGADQTSGNQRLAQCYEKLGRNSEAVAAYNRAIDALQADLAAGRGDKERLNAALDSCKQAIKVLGG